MQMIQTTNQTGKSVYISEKICKYLILVGVTTLRILGPSVRSQYFLFSDFSFCVIFFVTLSCSSLQKTLKYLFSLEAD